MKPRRRREFPLLGLGVVVVVIVLAAFATGAWLTTTRTDLPIPTPTSVPVSGPVPSFRHVYLIVLENHPYEDVIGDGDAPTINALAARGALATDYHAIGRPSQPNYIGLVSGSTQGVSDDGVHNLDASSLADLLEAKGLSWAVSAENLPSPCFTGQTASGGTDGGGNYARKHEPFISFTAVSGNPDRCGTHIHDLSAFDPAAANFQLIVPNLCNDAHDCPLRVADQWLAGFVPRIIDSTAFQDGGVLFLTFDEGNLGTDQVPMIAVGMGVQPGTRSADTRNHYAWLRTVEDAWSLACLASSCDAGNLSGLFSVPAASVRN
jgi:hypothetical protein